ncbi:MAG: hypothetical protein GOV00_03510 [Candidatus Altiarchaeota archaeon]|nr:hypothetical protein [Candidatus Altiarchaeota archaeon]
MMKISSLFLSFMIMAAMLPAFAQIDADSTGDAFEKGMSPILGLIKGATNVGWKMMQFFVGKDDVSIAYFSYNLGFRDDEVYIEAVRYQDPDNATEFNLRGNCSVGSLDLNAGDDFIAINCYNTADDLVRAVNLTDGSVLLSLSEIGDYNEDGTPGQIDDVFKYISRDLGKEIIVADGAKGQIMLFAIMIPSLILFFIVFDFFMSTGMLRTLTANIISGGITLLALRSGAFIGLLNMISSVFGANGFFLSLFGIYLLFAILIWFYGGIKKSWMMTSDEATGKVVDAVVTGFTADMKRGRAAQDEAEQMAQQQKGRK